MNVFIIAALTVDGFIAEERKQTSLEWTSKEDKKWFNERTKQAKVMVMGRTTYETIGRGLPSRVTIVMSSQADEKPFPRLEEGEVYFTKLAPKNLLAELKKQNYSEVALCGGSSIYTQFLQAGVVNKLYLTIEPILFGSGVGLLNESLNINLKLVETKKLNDQTLLLEYDVLS